MKVNDPNTTILTSCDSPKTAIIWLHGLGSHGSDFADFVHQINIPGGIKLILPHAPSIPVSLNGGASMPAWCDVFGLKIDAALDFKGVIKAIDYTHKMIDHEHEQGFPLNRIVLGGFSLGGSVALAGAVFYPKKIMATIGLSCFLNERAPLPLATEKSPPMLMCHGNHDTMVDISLGKDTINTLRSKQFDVDWHTFPMDHTICQEEINTMNEWLTSLSD